MPIEYSDNLARFRGCCTVEEAEGLLEWVIRHPKGLLDLSEVEHIHTAVLQVLLSAKPDIAELPPDPLLGSLLRDGLAVQGGVSP